MLIIVFVILYRVQRKKRKRRSLRKKLKSQKNPRNQRKSLKLQRKRHQQQKMRLMQQKRLWLLSPKRKIPSPRCLKARSTSTILNVFTLTKMNLNLFLTSGKSLIRKIIAFGLANTNIIMN